MNYLLEKKFDCGHNIVLQRFCETHYEVVNTDLGFFSLSQLNAHLFYSTAVFKKEQ